MDEQTVDVPTKICTGPCGRTLPATTENFRYTKHGKYGVNSQCRECERGYQKAYWQIRRNHPGVRERKKVYDKGYHQTYDAQPEAREHKRTYNRVYWQTYYSRPEVLEHRQTYYSHLEVQERERHRKRIQNHIRRARKRAVLGTHTPEEIQDMLRRHRYKCYYCRQKLKKVKGKYIYHIEHTFPLSRVVGSDIPANDISYLVPACPMCDNKKFNKFPWEFFEGGRLC